MHTSKRYEMFLQHTVQKQTKAQFVNNLAQVSLSPLPLFLSYCDYSEEVEASCTSYLITLAFKDSSLMDLKLNSL